MSAEESRDSVESTDTLFQTPTAVIVDRIIEEEAAHEKLESSRRDIGTSPDFDGPTTRSGKKQKHPAPIKSSGKKKNRMTTRSPTSTPLGDSQQGPGNGVPPRRHSRQDPATPTGAPHDPTADFATLPKNGLGSMQGSLQASMNGMESRLGEKFDNLEATVTKNKESIVNLTDAVNKNAVDLVRLETQLRSTEEDLDRRIADLARTQAGSSALSVSSSFGSSSANSSLARGLSSSQIERYWKCRNHETLAGHGPRPGIGGPILHP